MNIYKWKPIKDLPENWRELASEQLKSLASIWEEQASRHHESSALREFNERLGREWAIETGIIERLYSIDRGITQLLIEKGIDSSLIPHGATDKPTEQVISILNDHKNVYEGLFDFISQRRDLTTSYIKMLHQELTRHQETVAGKDSLGNDVEMRLLRGDWKKLPNNPTRPNDEIHEYCPPEHVSSEMDRMIEMHEKHKQDEVPPEIEAAWLHHRFTEIHPFQDGNGRVARSLSSLVFLRAKWFPLIVDRDSRSEYIAALEYADQGDIFPLINLFAKAQRKAFTRALSISENVLRGHEPMRQIINAIDDRFRVKQESQLNERIQVFNFSKHLENFTKNKLQEISDDLNQVLDKYNSHYNAFAQKNSEYNDFWFKQQIVDVAKELDYYADTNTYRAWVRLKIKSERESEIVISFHSLGTQFIGIAVASAFLFFRDRSDEDSLLSVSDTHPLSKEILQFSYNERLQSITDRYARWLDDVMITGLDQWRREILG